MQDSKMREKLEDDGRSKSKLAFPLSNKIYLNVIASLASELLRIKPYFFGGTPSS